MSMAAGGEGGHRHCPAAALCSFFYGIFKMRWLIKQQQLQPGLMLTATANGMKATLASTESPLLLATCAKSQKSINQSQAEGGERGNWGWHAATAAAAV